MLLQKVLLLTALSGDQPTANGHRTLVVYACVFDEGPSTGQFAIGTQPTGTAHAVTCVGSHGIGTQAGERGASRLGSDGD